MADQVAEILRLLSLKFYTAKKVFPDFDGAVESILERKLWIDELNVEL
jgi:hypothetical protein